jgi:probable HAF family extracellular repeat protein
MKRKIMRMRFAIRPLSAVGVALALAAASVCAAQTYKVTDLGDLPGGAFAQAQAINASGQITGMAGDSSGDGVVIRYSKGEMTNIGSLGGGKAIGNGINKSAQIAGYSTNASGVYRAFVTVDGKLVDIGDLGGGSATAYGLNDSGQVVGSSYLANGGGAHPFLYSNGKMIDLGTLGGVGWNSANGINNAGVVVGTSWAPKAFLGFVWKNGKMKSLGTLGGPYSEAYAINNKGQITGAADTAESVHAFITTGGKLKDLGVISGSRSISVGLAINDSGIVVGQSTSAQDGNYHACIYNGRKMLDLNNLIPPNTGWNLYVANGINDAGEIVGYGTRDGTTLHAFLLTPR